VTRSCSTACWPGSPSPRWTGSDPLQDLEPDAAGTPAPARGVRPPPRRLPRPSTNPGHRRIAPATTWGRRGTIVPSSGATASLSGFCTQACFRRITPPTWSNDVPLETWTPTSSALGVWVAGVGLGQDGGLQGVQNPPDDYGLANRWQPSQCDGGLLPPGRRRGHFEHDRGGRLGRCRWSWAAPLPRGLAPLQAVVTAVRPDDVKHHNQSVTRITDNQLEEGKNPE
jgi:hypothetical protein